MKCILYFCLLLTFCQVQSQTKVDSLNNVRDSLLVLKDSIKLNIEKVEKAIIKEIQKSGYKLVLDNYGNKEIEITEKPGYGEKIGALVSGDSIIIIGRRSIYYEVKYRDKIGYAYLKSQKFPLSLLDETKYKDIGKSSSVNSLSNFKNNNLSTTPRRSSYTSKNYSVQCSGRTKKGNRCRNKTKSSSGRCHLH